MNLTKNFASRRQSRRDSRQDRNEIFATWICSSATILARFAVAFRRDFGRRDYWFPARILVRFAAGPRRDFSRREFCFSARILARLAAGSRRDFGRREFRSRRDFGRRDFSSQWESRRDSRQIPILILQGVRCCPVKMCRQPAIWPPTTKYLPPWADQAELFPDYKTRHPALP